VFDALRGITCNPGYRRCVEWLGAPWGHAVAPSTPVQDYRLHVKAWQHHFAAIFGLEAGQLSVEINTQTSQELSRLGSERGVGVLDVTVSGSTPAATRNAAFLVETGETYHELEDGTTAQVP